MSQNIQADILDIADSDKALLLVPVLLHTFFFFFWGGGEGHHNANMNYVNMSFIFLINIMLSGFPAPFPESNTQDSS